VDSRRQPAHRGARPPRVRPLADRQEGCAFIVASETVAFDIIDAEYVRDVKPGEMVVSMTRRSGRAKGHPMPSPVKQVRRTTAFLSSSTSPGRTATFSGTVLNKVRRKLGKALAKARPVTPKNPDDKVIVINVPDSSNTATMGFVQGTNKGRGMSDSKSG